MAPMKPVTRGFYDPAMVFSKRVPRRDHGSRADVERDGFSVQVINRGEQLSYIDAERGEVIAEISIPTDWIDAESLDVWDFDAARPITDAQRAQILERVVAWWQARNQRALRVIRKSEQRGPGA